MMVRREVWDQAGGFNEDFPVAYNDVDFCLSLRKAGYLVVWTPFAELYHYESRSRGYDISPEKLDVRLASAERLRRAWRTEFEKGDPYFNPNLSLYADECTPAWKFLEPGFGKE